MEKMSLLLICFGLGFLLARWGKFGSGARENFGNFIIYISLPALVLARFQPEVVRPELFFSALMPWLIFGGAILFFLPLARLGDWPRPVFLAALVLGGLGNTSFVGIPMIEAFYGQEFITVGIVADQMGTFLVLALPMSVLLFRHTGGEGDEPPRLGRIVFKLLTFPPLVALVLAVLSQDVSLPRWLRSPLEILGDTLTPVALVTVGAVVARPGSGALAEKGALVLALVYKLILAPLLILGLALILGLSGPVVRVTIFEAAMGPMVTGAVVAMSLGVRPALVGLGLGLGVALSLVTAPVWSWLLEGII